MVRKEKEGVQKQEEVAEPKEEKKEEEQAEKKEEPEFFELENPCRILYSQEQYIE